MTDQVSGSSLPQTQDFGRQQQQQEQEQQQPRRHTHLHYRTAPSSHPHNHNHQHLHHARSQRNRKVDRRDTSDDDLQNTSDVVVIVETISVLQVTDFTGSTIIRTLPHDYAATPTVTSSQSESTVAGTTEHPSFTDLPDTSSTSSAGDDGDDTAGLSSSSSSSVIEESTVTPSGSSMPTTFPTLSYAPITATPSSAAPVFPSISGLSNSTLSPSSSAHSNSTISLHSFTSTSDGNLTLFGSATSTRSKTSHTSSSSSSSSSFSSSFSSSVFTHSVHETSTSESSSSATYFTSTAKPHITPANGSNGIGSPTNTGSGSDSVSTSASDSGNTSAATIAGSVVGAISGLAIILLLAAVFLRWKKRQPSTKLIQQSGNDRGYGAMRTGGSGGPAGDGDMSQRRRSIPFAIPAALANLSGHNRFSRGTASTDGGERGFAKISGRKLPPVLQFGGDGYTDPRATMMSDQSIDYRASQNFFGESPLSRLAVGAPMLQETSIPVFHASPARTAVETRGPFSDPFSDDHVIDSPTMLAPDPVGRSHLPHDRSTRSHASLSRFTEDI